MINMSDFNEKRREYMREYRKTDKYKEYIKTEKYREMRKIANKKYSENNPKKYKECKKLNNIKRNPMEKIKYKSVHSKTTRYIARKKLRPKKCSICWIEEVIIAHHTDYNKRFNVVFCCNVCHKAIHSWKIKCIDPVNLLELNNS